MIDKKETEVIRTMHAMEDWLEDIKEEIETYYRQGLPPPMSLVYLKRQCTQLLNRVYALALSAPISLKIQPKDFEEQ